MASALPICSPAYVRNGERLAPNRQSRDGLESKEGLHSAAQQPRLFRSILIWQQNAATPCAIEDRHRSQPPVPRRRAKSKFLAASQSGARRSGPMDRKLVDTPVIAEATIEELLEHRKAHLLDPPPHGEQSLKPIQTRNFSRL